ncbi:MAG: hypothetical protein Q8S18_00280 [Bacteroidales bacterium]|nr:hypothetical protein [Bacteroidales bacterium]
MSTFEACGRQHSRRLRRAMEMIKANPNYFGNWYVLVLVLFLVGCEKNEDGILTIENNSDITIWWKVGRSYPDTSLLIENTLWVVFSDPNAQIVKSHSKMSSISNDSKETWFKANFSNDTMMVFVFDSYVMTNLPWEQVKNEYLVLKRYNLSLDDLNRISWTLTYP